jgi:hypothetical protein
LRTTSRSSASRAVRTVLRLTSSRPLTRDPHGNIDIYNAELHKAQAAGAATWFKGAWLYEECAPPF